MIKLSYFRALEHASCESKCHASYSFSNCVFFKLRVILSLTFLNAVSPWFLLCLLLFLSLVMAPKVGRKYKTKANRNLGSSSSSSAYFDRVRFLTDKCEEIYETLTKYRSIWGERDIVLSELDSSICRNFMYRNWISLCEMFDPPPVTLIREFYSNLSVYSDFLD